MNFFGFVTTLSVWVISAVAHLPEAPPKVVLVPLGKLSAEKIKTTEAIVRTYASGSLLRSSKAVSGRHADIDLAKKGR